MLAKYIYSLKQHLVLPSNKNNICILATHIFLFQATENEIQSLESCIQLSQWKEK